MSNITNRTPFTLPPLSLYIHIPWCVKKCPYCDFNSHTSNDIPEQHYLEALKQDLTQDNHWIQNRKLHSIFFGGGTPSLFSAKAIASILNTAEQTIGFEPEIEITLEANPGTFEQQKFSDFFSAGVNRLSIGVQSFQEKHLQKLGRIHSSHDAANAVKMAQQAGFNNINIDLMHGLPDQTIREANGDLEAAISLNSQHISWYQLTIEPNTIFYRQPPPLPADELLADIQDNGQQLLANNGYQQYEVSAFSQANHQSRHNTNYWSFGDYIGIGAGAHGKFTDIQQQKILRRQKTRLPEHYLNYDNAPSFKETETSIEELPLEFLMNTLRLNQGVPVQYFEERTGLSLGTIEQPLEKLVRQGLLEETSTYLKTTDLGQRFLNTILSQFMESE